MAHELAAAGGGFLWPDLTLISDGVTISALCQQTPSDSDQVLRYLAHGRRAVPVTAFEAGVDRFVRLVIERAGDDAKTADLKSVWNDVLAERRDPEASMYRRIEAMLGFDPDQADETVIAGFVANVQEMGEAACMEAVSACRGDKPLRSLQSLREAVNGSLGMDGQIADININIDTTIDSRHPADLGRELARRARAEIGLRSYSAVDDKCIGDLLGVSVRQLEQQRDVQGASNSLSRRGVDGRDRIVLASRNLPGRRFAAARIVGDAIIARADQWRFATNYSSARQKVQRAFAAEFLVPIEDLDTHLNGSYDEDSIEGAAEFFGVSPMMISSHLANTGHISRNHPALQGG